MLTAKQRVFVIYSFEICFRTSIKLKMKTGMFNIFDIIDLDILPKIRLETNDSKIFGEGLFYCMLYKRNGVAAVPCTLQSVG